jgi:putative nucleotidyltransferase with HDIG domain
MGILKSSQNKSPAAKLGSRDTLHERSKYINHSLEFVNWVNHLGFEKTRLGSLFQRLDERFSVRRISILFIFSFMLSILVFYDFDFSYSVHLGDVASHDIKSPISFDYVDEITTEERRQSAEAAVPFIFDFDKYAFDDLNNRTYLAFRRMREETRKVNWLRNENQYENQVQQFFKFKPDFDKILGRNISDRDFEWLVRQNFSSRVENVLGELIENWSRYKIIDGLDKQVPANLREYVMREVGRNGRSGRDLVVSNSEVRDLLKEEDFLTDKILKLKMFNPKDQRILIETAHLLLIPNVTLNKSETAARKQKAKDEVFQENISIKKGQLIVAEGASIVPKHVTLLREIERRRSHRSRNFISLMTALMLVVLLLVCFSYLKRFTLNRVHVNLKEISIMGTVTFVAVILTKIFLFLTNAAFITRVGSMIPDGTLLFAAPVAAGSMLVGLLITAGEVVWIFSMFLSVVLGLMVDMKFGFMIVTMVGGIAAARGVYNCKRRNDLYLAGVRTGLVNALMIGLVITIERFGEPTYLSQLLWGVPAGFFSGIASSLVALMLVPLLETVFNVTTDVKLLELGNLNHPLLKEMLLKAPGTYHHSLVVGSMCEAAAEEIGANSLLAKVMCYYHDIGKIAHHNYFIENQKVGQNNHDHLSPHMSKTILISHVKDGLELALKYKLGKAIIDGIVQHHGTTLISFFYNRALENQDASMGDVNEVDFRYPGPKPQFREVALIMLADSIEAAARSLDEPTPARLENIVKNIIQRKFMDGQLDECNLTLKDLTVIELSFVRVLLGIYHQRIDYPKKAGGGAAEPVALKKPHFIQ